MKILIVILILITGLSSRSQSFTWNFNLDNWTGTNLGTASVVLNKEKHLLSYSTNITSEYDTLEISGWYFTLDTVTVDIDFPDTSTNDTISIDTSGIYIYYSKIKVSSEAFYNSYTAIPLHVKNADKVIKYGESVISVGGSWLKKYLSDTTCIVSKYENEQLLPVAPDTTLMACVTMADSAYYAIVLNNDSLVWSSNDNFGVKEYRDQMFRIVKPASNNDTYYYRVNDMSQCWCNGDITKRWYTILRGIRVSHRISTW